jgi:hypothetical protein
MEQYSEESEEWGRHEEENRQRKWKFQGTWLD